MVKIQALIDRLRSLPKEQRTRYVDRVGYTLSALMLFIIVLLMGGERLAPVREAVGLGWLIKKDERPRALFGDCSKPENRSSPSCAVKERSRVEGEWKSLKHRESGKPPPFSLSGR